MRVVYSTTDATPSENRFHWTVVPTGALSFRISNALYPNGARFASSVQKVSNAQGETFHEVSLSTVDQGSGDGNVMYFQESGHSTIALRGLRHAGLQAL